MNKKKKKKKKKEQENKNKIREPQRGESERELKEGNEWFVFKKKRLLLFLFGVRRGLHLRTAGHPSWVNKKVCV